MSNPKTTSSSSDCGSNNFTGPTCSESRSDRSSCGGNKSSSGESSRGDDMPSSSSNSENSSCAKKSCDNNNYDNNSCYNSSNTTDTRTLGGQWRTGCSEDSTFKFWSN